MYRACIGGGAGERSGALVPGVRIVPRHQASNLTCEAGRCLLDFLHPGGHVVTEEKAGYQKPIREDMKLLL